MSTTLSSKTVTTRKPHKCFGCRKAYPAGSRMTRSATADYGSVFRWYLCETCDEVARWGDDWRWEFGEGDLYDGDREYWDEVHAELLAAKEATP